jgi:uncharacterized protein (TIRG00374 family)
MTSALKSNKKKWLYIIAWAVASAGIYFAVQKLQWDSVLTELKNAHLIWLFLAVTGNFCILIFATLQWLNFLPGNYPVRFPRMFEIIALVTMTSNTVPFLAGHALAIVLLAKREKVGHAVALSVIALDQFAEGFAKLSLFLLVALLAPIPEWMRQGILLALSAIILLFGVMLFFAFRHRHFKIFMSRQSHPRWYKVWRFISRCAHHLEALRSVRLFAVGMGTALAMKGVEVFAIWAIQKSMGVELPFWTILLVLASVSLVSMVPVSPGNLGVYEAAVFFVYQYLGLPAEQALGLALLQHICLLIPYIATGYLILLLRNFFPLRLQG